MIEVAPTTFEASPAIFIDMLGGDSAKSTESHDYEGDALPRNLAAWESVLERRYHDIIKAGITFTLFGRTREIQQATRNAVNRATGDDSLGFSKWLEVIDCAEQTPMGAKKPARGSSMQQMFKHAKERTPNFVYTAGATGAEGTGAGSFRDRDNRERLFIAKQLMPGVEFGDNGALVHPRLEDYVMMERVLRERSVEYADTQRVMILPSDYFEETEIYDYLEQEAQISNFLPFNPLAELGFLGEAATPSEILSDGFIGNLHLKFMELLYRDRAGLFALMKGGFRARIKNRVLPLEKERTEGGFKWTPPKNLDEKARIGILCNGAEDTKGTAEIKAMMKGLDTNRFYYIEPKDLLENPGLTVLATPASKALVDAFFEESLLTSMLKHIPAAWHVLQAKKRTTAMAEFVNLKAGAPRIMAAHGTALAEETAKNFSALIDMVIYEQNLALEA